MSTVSTRVAALRERISAIDERASTELLGSLNARKRAELEFHDAHRDRVQGEVAPGSDTYEKLYGNKKYYAATGASREYTNTWIKRHAPGAIFLDYACGNGHNATLAAKAGAALSLGLDISPISVSNAREDAAKSGLGDNIAFIQGDCENTKLPDASVDVAVCSGMLHHLDLSYAFPELRRILRPGGRILAVEALDYNPAIKLYRYLTPQMRTEWETSHILSLKDIKFARRFFEIGEVRYWHIFGIAAPHAGALAPLLHKCDDVLTRIPGVRLMAWIFTFELLRRANDQ